MKYSSILFEVSKGPTLPVVKRVTRSDLSHSLKCGVDDFLAMPSHVVFLCVIYPLVCILLFAMTFGYPLLPLVLPIGVACALVGPPIAAGLHEISRRREAGLDSSWGHALNVLNSPAVGAIVAFSFLLIAIFLVWLAIAKAIYTANLDYVFPSIVESIDAVLDTPAAWTLIIAETAVGLFVTVLVFTLSAISLPLLLDRDVGPAVALLTSIRVVVANPLNMARWGFTVTTLLVIGSIPFFVCLAVVLPVLGHATWHLYRRTVSPARAQFKAPEEDRNILLGRTVYSRALRSD
jgi:uncharacterized membrane protein